MRSPGRKRALLWITVFLFGAPLSAAADDVVHLTLIDTGASDEADYYQPQKLPLSTVRPWTLIALPTDPRSPLYGVIPFGSRLTAAGRVFHVVVSSPDDENAVLYVYADTGTIPASGDALRGGSLEKTVRKAPRTKGKL
jgi:hypothetical protein